MENYYCVIPFIHLHVNNFGKVTPCCINHKSLGDTREESIDSIWNGKSMSEFRERMRLGQKDSSCETCYNKEQGGVESLRLQYNKRFSKYNPKINDREATPIYLDIRFSNLCNMKCRMCWHGASSLWFEDAKKLEQNIGQEALIKAEGSFPLIEQIATYLPVAEEFYFAGGEPLVMEEHYKLLQLLSEHNRSDVKLRYNTNFMNLGMKKYDLFELWGNFEDILLSISIDEVLDRADYIRKGTSYEKLLKNRILLRERAPHVKINVAPTISILNIFTICSVLKQLVDDGFVTYDEFYINILQEPRRYNIKLLPENEKKLISDRVEKFISTERIPERLAFDLRGIVSYMQSEDWSEHIHEFKEYNVKLDNLRGESFIEAYKSEPELIKLYELL